MTDVDRLRAAADRLDTYADDFHSREFAHRASQDRVTAALLRAVADAHARQEGEPDDGPCLCCGEVTAALALADAVLGGQR